MISCLLCGTVETQYSFQHNSQIESTISSDATSMVCSGCISKLLSTGLEKIERYAQKLKSQNQIEQAETVQKLFGGNKTRIQKEDKIQKEEKLNGPKRKIKIRLPKGRKAADVARRSQKRNT